VVPARERAVPSCGCIHRFAQGKGLARASLRRAAVRAICLSLVLLAACDLASDTNNPGGRGGSAGNGAEGGVGGGGSGHGGASGGEGGSGAMGAGGGAGGAPACDLVYATDFAVPVGAWPAEWSEAGGVADASIESGRAHLFPILSNYSLARMKLAGDEENVDIVFRFELSEPGSQGIGVYARQNGGYLGQTTPNGAGYVAFIEGFTASPGIGVWYERDGVEVEIADAPFTVLPATPYLAHFRVLGEDATHTRLQASVWPAGDPEPTSWQLDLVDDQDHLQGTSGGFAIDAWSSRTTGDAPPADLSIDDLTICRLP
jgi:hypothetical protein